MELINELELRKVLKQGLDPEALTQVIVRHILDPETDFEDKRGFWFYLLLTHRKSTLAHAARLALQSKIELPLELLIVLGDETKTQPKPIVIEALLKGLRKLKTLEAVFAARAWDKWDKRISTLRSELTGLRVREQLQVKEGLLEKFWFLRNQRMADQAGRVLRRLLELYPEDAEFLKLKREFDEQWARDVLANHVADMHGARIERTRTTPSSTDEAMLRSFLLAAEKLFLENRDAAADLAIAFLFMEDYARALEALNWAAPTAAGDWLRCELLLYSRHFLEGLEFLNQLEIKYGEDPESTFSISYLRSQYLHGLGQHGPALEIMQSIVRVRPNYRSAHALILEWTEGVVWE